jgi:oligoendopeptidase F
MQLREPRLHPRRQPGIYLGFLRAGGSAYPLDILKQAGVDLASPQPVEETFGVMEEYIDRLEELLN